jgi:hypothetical protein
LRHLDTTGPAPRRCWLRLLWIVGLFACLNPRPEELPNQTTPVGGDIGAGGSGTPGDYPTPDALPITPDAPGEPDVEGGGQPGDGSLGAGGAGGLDGGADGDETPDAGGG